MAQEQLPAVDLVAIIARALGVLELAAMFLVTRVDANKMPLTMLNIVELMPIPSPSVVTAGAVNHGFFTSCDEFLVPLRIPQANAPEPTMQTVIQDLRHGIRQLPNQSSGRTADW